MNVLDELLNKMRKECEAELSAELFHVYINIILENKNSYPKILAWIKEYYSTGRNLINDIVVQVIFNCIVSFWDNKSKKSIMEWLFPGKSKDDLSESEWNLLRKYYRENRSAIDQNNDIVDKAEKYVNKDSSKYKQEYLISKTKDIYDGYQLSMLQFNQLSCNITYQIFHEIFNRNFTDMTDEEFISLFEKYESNSDICNSQYGYNQYLSNILDQINDTTNINYEDKVAAIIKCYDIEMHNGVEYVYKLAKMFVNGSVEKADLDGILNLSRRITIPNTAMFLLSKMQMIIITILNLIENKHISVDDGLKFELRCATMIYKYTDKVQDEIFDVLKSEAEESVFNFVNKNYCFWEAYQNKKFDINSEKDKHMIKEMKHLFNKCNENTDTHFHLNDKQWAVIKKILIEHKHRDDNIMRNCIDAIVFKVITKSSYRKLPDEYPCTTTVSNNYKNLKDDGTLLDILNAVVQTLNHQNEPNDVDLDANINSLKQEIKKLTEQ